MAGVWVTNSSTTVEAMINPLTAALDDGFEPDQVHLLETSEVRDEVDRFVQLTEDIFDAYGAEPPSFNRTGLDEEVQFERIRSHHHEAIEEAHDRGDEVAVDITPGRKFMSAIAFAAGMRYNADHVYYFYLSTTDHYGRLYPEIPRTAAQLYDFTEAV